MEFAIRYVECNENGEFIVRMDSNGRLNEETIKKLKDVCEHTCVKFSSDLKGTISLPISQRKFPSDGNF